MSHPFAFAPGLRVLFLLVGWLAGLGATRAQFDLVEKRRVTPSLVADTAAVAPGKPFAVGVRLKMEPGWHVYWQFSGDSGKSPKIEWELPAGFKAGPIQWPLPTAHIDEGKLLTYVYENEVLLMVEITPPATLPPGDVTLKAHLSWLVCEKICVPGKGDVELKLTPGEPAPANAELFTQWRAQLPKTADPPFQIKWDRSKPSEFSLHVSGLPKETKAEFFPLPPKDAKPAHPKVSEIAADGARTITFPIEDGGAPNLPWRGVLATGKDGAPREGWLVSASKADAPSSTGSVAPPPSAVAVPADSGGLAWKLLAAFLGGLILNVMPCVLPVIALKIFGFVNQAGQDPARIFRLGLAFTAGVFVFFLLLATAVVQLKTAFNWGYVLQNPYSLSFVVVVIFAFSFNLLGVFEIALGGATASKLGELSGREGFGGAFLHGFFTTLLGTSCTAPFLAASLGYATTQPAPIIYLIFLAIATGMALPYFLLTARPAWLRLVPKPGAWMERVKQFMGFVMLAVAVWLFGVLAGRGADVAAGMGWLLLLLGLGCWIVGTWQESALARVALVALVVGGYFFFLHGKLAAPQTAEGSGRVMRTGSITWEPYSEERLAEARKAGQPVFVDFTADWCLNCKLYEGAVLATDKVGAKFAGKKIVALRADWTNTDNPVVTRALKSFGRVGVPLYVLYRPGEAQPVVADALTTGWLLAELDRIKN
jgi:thiol:disulfide interchange protein DsbD